MPLCSLYTYTNDSQFETWSDFPDYFTMGIYLLRVNKRTLEQGVKYVKYVFLLL